MSFTVPLLYHILKRMSMNFLWIICIYFMDKVKRFNFFQTTVGPAVGPNYCLKNPPRRAKSLIPYLNETSFFFTPPTPHMFDVILCGAARRLLICNLLRFAVRTFKSPFRYIFLHFYFSFLTTLTTSPF